MRSGSRHLATFRNRHERFVDDCRVAKHAPLGGVELLIFGVEHLANAGLDERAGAVDAQDNRSLRMIGKVPRPVVVQPWRHPGASFPAQEDLCYRTGMAESSLSERERWALVNARLRDEARQAGMETKLVQLAALMASVDDFGWREALSDDAHVWELWTRLRNVERAMRVDATASSRE